MWEIGCLGVAVVNDFVKRLKKFLHPQKPNEDTIPCTSSPDILIQHVHESNPWSILKPMILVANRCKFVDV